MFSLRQERLGAVACLQLAVKHFNIEDHVVVIGGYVDGLAQYQYDHVEMGQALTNSSPFPSTVTLSSRKTLALVKCKRSFLTCRKRTRTAVWCCRTSAEMKVSFTAAMWLKDGDDEAFFP